MAIRDPDTGSKERKLEDFLPGSGQREEAAEQLRVDADKNPAGEKKATFVSHQELDSLPLSGAHSRPSVVPTVSRLAQMERGEIPSDLARVFRWLPPVGSEDNPNCRLGNRLSEYLNSTSELTRQQSLERLKKEARRLGPKALELVRSAVAFDAAVRLLDAQKRMRAGAGEKDLEASGQRRMALAELAGLSKLAAAPNAVRDLLDRLASKDEKEQAFQDADALAKLRIYQAAHTLTAVLVADGLTKSKEQTKTAIASLQALARDAMSVDQPVLSKAADLLELADQIRPGDIGNPEKATAVLLQVRSLAGNGNVLASAFLEELLKDPNCRGVKEALLSPELLNELKKTVVFEKFIEGAKHVVEQLVKLTAEINADVVTPTALGPALAPLLVPVPSSGDKDQATPPVVVPALAVPSPPFSVTPNGPPEVTAPPAAPQIWPGDLPPLVVPAVVPIAEGNPAVVSAAADKPNAPEVVGDGEALDPLGDKDRAEPEKRGNWKPYRLEISDRRLVIPESGVHVVIGRNPQDTDIVVADPKVSRRHCQLVMTRDGPCVQDLGSLNGTFIIRNGTPMRVGQLTRLEPGDQIRLGNVDAPLVGWVQTRPMEMFKPVGYVADKVPESPDQAARDRADPAASIEARERSNEFLRNHQYGGRLPDGFQVLGGSNLIGEDGRHNDSRRASFVVDSRLGKDQALEKFLADCRRDLAHLKGKPEELARELAKRVKSSMEPAGWSAQQVNDGYLRLRDENAGGRLLLGDFISAAQKGQGAGACMQEATLLKVAFDSFYPEESSRPRLRLVRGFIGDNPAGLTPEEAMNHAWTILESEGREKIFDPRLQVLGETRGERPGYQPGNEIAQLRSRASDQLADKVAVRYADLVGKIVRYKDETWRVKSVADGTVVLVADGLKDVSMAKLRAANPGVTDFKVGEIYKIKRSDDSIDEGWVLRGWRDPVRKSGLVLTKENALERTVPMAEISRSNPHIFADLQQDSIFKPPQPADAQKVREYGLVPGREVAYDGKKWHVAGTDHGAVQLVRAADRWMLSREFKRLNGDRKPAIGEEVWYQKGTGALEKWPVVEYDDASGQVRVRSETAHKTSVSIERLFSENPEIERQHRAIDLKQLFEDPRSKVVLEWRYTKGNSGHDKWMGYVEGPNGERIKVMVHKPPGGGGIWNRLRNDLAAQTIADLMLGKDKAPGEPGLFPETVKRDGMMVQSFVGIERETLDSFMHDLSARDAVLRAAEPDLEKRITKFLEKCDPKLRLEIERTIVFSLLLGDYDQHGGNFLVERIGSKPEDVKVLRVDTDYAFGTHEVPFMDRHADGTLYGDVVHGAFVYFSQRELSPEVRAQVVRVSAALNQPDPEAQDAARSRFARENQLSRESVDALAERARFLAEGGKFPTSQERKNESDRRAARPAEARPGQPRPGENINPLSVLKGEDPTPRLGSEAALEDHRRRVVELTRELPANPTPEQLRVFNEAVAAEVRRYAKECGLVDVKAEVGRARCYQPGEYKLKTADCELTVYITGPAVPADVVEKVLHELVTHGSKPKTIEFVHDPINIGTAAYDQHNDRIYIYTGFGGRTRDLSYLHEWGHHLDYVRLDNSDTWRPRLDTAFDQGIKKSRALMAMKIKAVQIGHLKENLEREQKKAPPDEKVIGRLREKLAAEEKILAHLDPNHLDAAEHRAALQPFEAQLDLICEHIFDNRRKHMYESMLVGQGDPVEDMFYFLSAREVTAESMMLATKALEEQARTGKLPSYKEMLERFTKPNDPRRASHMEHFEKLFAESVEFLRQNAIGPVNANERPILVRSVGWKTAAEGGNDLVTQEFLERSLGMRPGQAVEEALKEAVAAQKRGEFADVAAAQTWAAKRFGKPLAVQEQELMDDALRMLDEKPTGSDKTRRQHYEQLSTELRRIQKELKEGAVTVGQLKERLTRLAEINTQYDLELGFRLGECAEKNKGKADSEQAEHAARLAEEVGSKADRFEKVLKDFSPESSRAFNRSAVVNLCDRLERPAKNHLSGYLSAWEDAKRYEKTLVSKRGGCADLLLTEAQAVFALPKAEWDAALHELLTKAPERSDKSFEGRTPGELADSLINIYLLKPGESAQIRFDPERVAALERVRQRIRTEVASESPGAPIRLPTPEIVDGAISPEFFAAVAWEVDCRALETLHKIERAKAEAILACADSVVARGTAPELALDTARLMVLQNMPEGQAKDGAKIIGELRRHHSELPFDRLSRMAASEQILHTICGGAVGEVKQVLLDAIKAASAGSEIADIHKFMLATAERRAKEAGPSAAVWTKLLETLKGGEDKLKPLLGMDAGQSDPQTMQEEIKVLQLRLQNHVGTVLRGPVDITKIAVEKALVSESLIAKFHERLTELYKGLNEKPEDTARILRNTVLDLFAEHGIENPLLNAERIEFACNNVVSQPVIEYFDKHGKKLTRQGAAFVYEDSKQKVDRNEVRTVVALPESLLRLGGGELSRALYVAVLQQTNVGPTTAAEAAGMHEYVTRVLAKNVPLPEPATAAGESGGLNVSTLPAEQASKPVEVTISEKGIKVNGIERELSFAEVWRNYIEDLKGQLKEEERRREPDQSRVQALREKIDKEEQFASRLQPEHPNRGEHEAAVKLAQERLREFKAKEGDVERLAREKGGGNHARGRLVALTILAGFFIGESQKAAAKDR